MSINGQGATGFIKNETGQEPGVGLEGSPGVTDHWSLFLFYFILFFIFIFFTLTVFLSFLIGALLLDGIYLNPFFFFDFFFLSFCLSWSWFSRWQRSPWNWILKTIFLVACLKQLNPNGGLLTSGPTAFIPPPPQDVSFEKRSQENAITIQIKMWVTTSLRNLAAVC